MSYLLECTTFPFGGEWILGGNGGGAVSGPWAKRAFLSGNRRQTAKLDWNNLDEDICYSMYHESERSEMRGSLIE